MSSIKLRVVRAITRPVVGRLVARLTGNSIRVKGARINTASPLISDSTRAKLAFGFYESAELRFVHAHLRSDLDVVELGSSIGVVGSVVLRRLDPGRRLIAVEADDDLAAIARRNFEANSGAATWALEVAAISYGAQAGLTFVRGAQTTGGRLTRSSTEDADDDTERLTLSELLTRHHVDRYALIADIEGAEAGIILEDELALGRCDQLIIELHDTDDMHVADLRTALVDRHAFSVIAARGPVLVCER